MNLKPPVTIEKLMDEWVEDSKISADEVDIELLRISNHHSKYLNIMSYHRHIIHKLDKDYKTLKDFKSDYYAGHLNDPETLAKHNLEPIQRVMSLPEIGRKIEADKELTDILLKKVAHQEIVDYCSMVLKSLGNRTWDLKAFVDYRRFLKGT